MVVGPDQRPATAAELDRMAALLARGSAREPWG